MHKIMIVEDDKALLNGITLALKCADMEVVPCHNIKSAQTRLAGVNFDLVILDINLPDGNGLDLLRELKETSAMPVIMLTANDMETDIVAGLEMGADDYITKPFSLAVLRARVNTQLRKQTAKNTNRFEQDNFVFDFDLMEYFKNGTSVCPRPTELFSVGHFFVYSHPLPFSTAVLLISAKPKNRKDGTTMKKIDLKDYYVHITTDTYIDIPDEVFNIFEEHRKAEQAYQSKVYYHKAYYSLDRGDGIEHSASALFASLSPDEIYERKLTKEQLSLRCCSRCSRCITLEAAFV